ncbi:MAG: flagellar basal body rod protein FlgC [Alphaproteobacteria bacterium]
MSDGGITSSTAMAVAATALRAQEARMRIIAENMANAESTSKDPGGDPYRRQVPVFEPMAIEGGARGVRMARVQADKTPFKTEYDPGNPSADATGYVKMPNVDPLIEAMDLREAQRAYEASLNVIEASRDMQSRTLELLKK